jgi:hypothetical protein
MHISIIICLCDNKIWLRSVRWGWITPQSTDGIGGMMPNIMPGVDYKAG